MSTLTKTERQALDELFISMRQKRNFLQKLHDSRKEMIKIFKFLIKTQRRYPKKY